jgi:hypothetical protein
MYLTQKGVKRLVHITKFEKLSSILKKGLSPNAANGRGERVHPSIQYTNVPLFVGKRSRDYLAILVSPLLTSREDAVFTQSTFASPREIPVEGVYGINTLFHQEVLVFGLGKINRDVNHPANMPTSLMAEVMFRKEIPPSEIVSLVFPSLESVIRYEDLHGPLPNGVHWKADQELAKEEKVFSFWKDICDSLEAYEWIHQFIDHRRRAKER